MWPGSEWLSVFLFGIIQNIVAMRRGEGESTETIQTCYNAVGKDDLLCLNIHADSIPVILYSFGRARIALAFRFFHNPVALYLSAYTCCLEKENGFSRIAYDGV